MPGWDVGSNSQRRRALFQRFMVAVIVLMAVKSMAPPCFDVGGQVIDVKGFFGHQFVAFDRRLIKAVERFHAADFMRHHGAMEVREHRIGFIDPGVMDGIDVGK